MSGLSEVCRLCMKEFSSPHLMENIFLSEAVTLDTIRTVTQIKVVMGDGLPPNVCKVCICKLNNAKSFIESCIECNEKLKLECRIRASILAASNATNSVMQVSTPADSFPAQIKTEYSPNETAEQNVNLLTLAENEDEVYLKYEIFDETDAADICGPIDQNNTLESDPVDSNLVEAAGQIIDDLQGAHERSTAKLSIEYSDLHVKKENIAALEENNDELLLPAKACDLDMLELQKIESQAFISSQETNLMGSGDNVSDLTEPIPPLQMVMSASCHESSCSPAHTSIPAVGEESSIETATVEVHEKNTVDYKIKSPDTFPQVPLQPSSLKSKSARKSLLLRLAQQRKRGVQCMDCCRIFPRLLFLRQHACDATESCKAFDSSRMFECDRCLAGFSSLTSLEIHKKQHTTKHFCYVETEPHSQDSDFDVNSSDSENSIFELNIPDSENSNHDSKSSDSEGSNRKALIDSKDPVLVLNSDSDSCELNKISSETDNCGSNSDSEEEDIDTSVDSEGSGLVPNSGSDSDYRNTSTESDDSVTKPEDFSSESDLDTDGDSFVAVDSNQGTVTTVENECQVCPMPTTIQNTSENELVKEGGKSLDSRISPLFLAENPTAGSARNESGFCNSGSASSSEDSTAGLNLLHSDGGISPTERYTRREDADNKQKRKRSCADWEGNDLFLKKRRRLVDSKHGLQEKCKGRMPLVQPGESRGILASIGPVCNTTKSRSQTKNFSHIPHREKLQSRLDTVNSCASQIVSLKLCLSKKEKGQNIKLKKETKPKIATTHKVNGADDGNHKDGEISMGSVVENQKHNTVSVDRELENETKEIGSENTRLGERGEFKLYNNLNVEATATMKTEEHQTCGKKVTENVVAESVKGSSEKAKAKGMKENGISSKISSYPSYPEDRGLKNLHKERKSMDVGAPVLSYQCWECSRKFESGNELIAHFRRHLKALLLRHTC